MEKNKSIYLIQILCSLLIVNYHTYVLDIPVLHKIAKGGFILNTIFVFLSGYLLSISFSKKTEYSFTSFMKKRVKRIYPSFLIVLLLILAYSFITDKSISILSYLKWFTGFGYFFTTNEIFSNIHLWFVSVILVCYLIFIPTYKIISKHPFIYVLGIVTSIIVYQLFFNTDGLSFYNTISFDRILRFLYHYLVFSLAIYWQQSNRNIEKMNGVTLGVFCMCTAFYFYLSNESVYSFLKVIVVIPLVFSLLPILYNMSGFFEKYFPFIFKLNAISYELYLIHFVVINVMNEYLHSTILSYPLTFVISIPFAFLIQKGSSFVQKLGAPPTVTSS